MPFTPVPCRIDDITFHAGGGIGGHDVHRAICVCSKPLRGWTREDAQAAFDRHAAIAAPSADVLARPITRADVQAYPEYFIDGPGRALASVTDCGHGCLLTDSPCSLCD